MNMNKLIKKEERQDDIVILDEGIDAKNVIEPLSWLCCVVYFFPYRAG
jgi:hypothetical protein